MDGVVRSFFGLRIVAIFEATKGLLVLVAGVGAFRLLHGAADLDIAAENIVRQLRHCRLPHLGALAGAAAAAQSRP